MRRTGPVCALVLGSLVGLGCFELPGGSPQKACTLIGCTSGASLDAVSITDVARLEGSTVRVCRNAVCSELVLPAVPTMVGVGAAVTVQAPLHAQVVVVRSADGAQIVAETIEVSGPAAHLQDGDVYTVEVREAGGGIVVERAWTATYVESYPNGPDCDPAPCVQARLTAR